MNIETTTIQKKKTKYTVTDIEDMYITVSVEQVEEILGDSEGVEEEEIVLLLATIKKNRVLTSTFCSFPEKPNDEVATKAIIKLLEHYAIGHLISAFEEMKFYQIKQVLTSDNPVQELDEHI